jgi:hypothetical protein
VYPSRCGECYLLSSLANTLLFPPPQTLIREAVAIRCIIIMELVSVGRNREIMQLGKMCPGSRMTNAWHRSNYRTAPTSPHAAAEILPWGYKGKCTICVPVLLHLNRCLRNGAMQTQKDAYISMALILRLLEESAFCFCSSPYRTNKSQLC